MTSLPALTPLTTWGTPYSDAAQRILLLGSGELGKEVAIAATRLGLEVIAVDAYANAPAMQVAHRSYVIDMLDGVRVRYLIEQEKPGLIVPEIEAIATDTLLDLETEGWRVVPTARATRLTMNREGIRRLAAEELGLPTSPYRFAESEEEYQAAIAELGFPCVVKPTMSSSGKGQSLVRSLEDVAPAWDYACKGGRGREQRVIVEGFIHFDLEITLLTVQGTDGVHFCPPIGHRQEDGDYRESWQPCPLHPDTWAECQRMAAAVTSALGGWGLFGVELFITGDASAPQQVYFSEVSPRPHDTGMVTLISQPQSEFDLHVRAILGLPIGEIPVASPAASAVILAPGSSEKPRFTGMAAALAIPTSQLRLFGKPRCHRNRRMGVALALGDTVEEARDRARTCADRVRVLLD